MSIGNRVQKNNNIIFHTSQLQLVASTVQHFFIFKYSYRVYFPLPVIYIPVFCLSLSIYGAISCHVINSPKAEKEDLHDYFSIFLAIATNFLWLIFLACFFSFGVI